MQARHLDRERYFREQAYTTEKHVIPFLEPFMAMQPGLRILEVGCGEGGNLQPFLECGCTCVGVELLSAQVERAKTYFANHPRREHLQLLVADIYTVNPEQLGGEFDLIFLRDVIEHIPEQARFMQHIHHFLKPSGRMFFGFPPWYMPFGGHQQICQSRLLSYFPYLHLLPKAVYRQILQWFGEKDHIIQELMEIVDTGISIERFRRIIPQSGFVLEHEQLWLINPNYEVKFGLQPRKLWPVIGWIPFLRNFIATCGYVVIKKGVDK